MEFVTLGLLLYYYCDEQWKDPGITAPCLNCRFFIDASNIIITSVYFINYKQTISATR